MGSSYLEELVISKCLFTADIIGHQAPILEVIQNLIKKLDT